MKSPNKSRAAQLPRLTLTQRTRSKRVDALVVPILQSATIKRMSYAEGKAALIHSYEILRLEHALQRANGNVALAAEHLGLWRQSLQTLMRRYGLPIANRGRRANAHHARA